MLERATTLQEGIDHLGKRQTDVVLLDLIFPTARAATRCGGCARPTRRADRGVHERGRRRAAAAQRSKAGAQDYLGKGDFETGPLIHRCLRYAIERMRIVEEKQRLQDRLDEAERMQSLGVLGAGAAFGFNQLIGTILDHTDEALSTSPTPDSRRARGSTCSRCARRRCARWSSPCSCATTRAPTARRCGRSTSPSSCAPTALSSRQSRARDPDRVRPRDARPAVSANPLELRQLLHNLVINASEAIRPHRGRIRDATGSFWADPELLARGAAAPELREGCYTLLS